VSGLKQYRIGVGSAAELVAHIEADIASGALSAGERLPSVRRLAGEVGLSPATVASALAELRRRGVVLSEPRRGTRIGTGPPIGGARPPLPVPAGARDLSLGNPDPALLPDLKLTLADSELPVRLYGQAPIDGELLEFARRQMDADAIPSEHLCVLSGTMDAIERVLQAHLRPGDRVAVEDPGYAALYDLLRAQGLALEPVAVDDHGMRAEGLERALRRGTHAVIVTPRGQNPFGAAIDATRARELGRVLVGFPDALVIEDDHLGALAGVPLHPLIGDRERWAVTRSVAKALGPDLRLAVLAGDATTVARVRGRQQCGPGWVSHVLQTLVLGLWRDPAVTALVARAADTYTHRRERLLASLAANGIDAHGASGLNVWIPVADEAAAIGALMQRGWVLAPGAPYRVAAAQPGVRVTTAALSEHEAEQLATDIAAALTPGVLSRSG